MNRALEKLIRTAERLCVLYEELLACSKEKTELLVACSVDGIAAAQGREEMIVDKLLKMQQLREEALREAAQALGCKTIPPTISALILMLDTQSEERTTLQGLRDKLAELSKELAAANRLNEQLCTQSLTHLEVYISLLTGRGGKAAIYGANGKARQYNGRAMLSRTA